VKANTIVGFYGKLPVVGDFISRRLPNEFIGPWDDWLQSSIATSREQLGGNWLASYLTSPIWRFLLSPGLCGSHAVAGIVMPSVDKVGRYFPLTVAVLFEQPPQLPFLFSSGNAWFEQLEDAALAALEGSLDLTAFDQLLHSIPPFALPIRSFSLQTSEKKKFYIGMENSRQIGDAFVELNANLLATFMSGYSLWCSEGSEQVQPALLAYEGLPPIGSFSELLKGRADNKRWNDHCESADEPFTSKPKSIFVAANQETESVDSSLNSIITNNTSLTKLGWRSWAVTDTGKRRTHNEDSFLNRPEACLWVVADGMGGHKAGDVASQLIVNSLKKLSPTEPLESYIDEVEHCLQDVNSMLQHLAAKEYDNHLIGSTVVSLICDTQRCAFLWAGDSRLYCLRNNQLQQLTQDHCVDDENTSSGAVKNSNVITRAVGADEELELDVGITEVFAGDIFLLCSDGLDKEMSFNELEQIMQTTKCQDIANTLINQALARGARDNVTVIVVTAEANL